MNAQKKAALAAIEEKQDLFYRLSDDIWEHPELGFQEQYAAKRQMETLEQLGFEDIKSGLAGIPTAFSGSWGHGKPVIAVMGEFDALAGLSQEAGATECRQLVPGGSGHGCGHNLLGTGAIAAAYGIKEYLRATGKSGTVIYYGCPAEENGSGKTFMARDGIFDDLDCTLYWHPSAANKVNSNSSLANFAIRYCFTGVSAHAAASPHMGRSALDALELMNTGVQYLREHVIPQARIHYAITDTGGVSPNVVQAHAEVSYLIRAPKVSQVQAIYERVNKIARGAAMMTETEVEICFDKATSDQRINMPLNEVLYANMTEIPLPAPTQEELDYAAAIRKATGKTDDPGKAAAASYDPAQAEWIMQQPRVPLCQYVMPLKRKVGLDSASGDLGDVSKLCPTGEIGAAVWAAGTPAHTWQAAAQGKSSWAKRHMIFAAKVLTGAGVDLLEDPEKLAAAKAEFEKAKAEEPYVCPIPPEVGIPTR